MTRQSCRDDLLSALATIAVSALLFSQEIPSSEAQIATNITPTPSTSHLGLGTVTTPQGNTTAITGGTRVGTSLFHSFNTFSVGTGAIAQFQNTGSISPPLPSPPLGAAAPQAAVVPQGPATANIFSRVIGGQPSQIDGTIQTSGFGSANFWFMNPSGIVFGSHAQLDIGGSAAFTTANNLTLRDPDGNTRIVTDSGYPYHNKTVVPLIFSTTTTHVDLTSIPGALGIHPVAAFGFLGQVKVGGSTEVRPAGITINDSLLTVPTGKVLALAAGDVTINGGQLSAPNGAVRITGVGPFDSPQRCDCYRYRSSYGSNSIQVSSYVNVASNATQAHTSVTTNAPEGQEGSIPKSSFGSITIGQGSTEAVIGTASNGQIQLNSSTYQGTNNTGWIASNGQPVNLEIIDGILVAKLPPTQLIVSSPVVKSLTPDTSVDVGGNGPLTVTLNHAFTRNVPVQVNSDNTNVASVTPTAVTVPAGSNSAPVTPGVHGVAPGTTSVKASVGTTAPAGAPVNVTANVQTLDASLSNSVAAINSVAAGKALTSPLPSTYANQLVMASDGCAGSKTGEFSSFVQRGRDAAPPQPGGMLASPLGVEAETPKIGGLSILPASAAMRGLGTLNFAPGVAAFLQREKGC